MTRKHWSRRPLLPEPDDELVFVLIIAAVGVVILMALGIVPGPF